ncbi:MAG: leucine-rich repeat protein [Firmicutes bacterium]|nr:leucine-rich repeat protein [Bacillota bacterium]
MKKLYKIAAAVILISLLMLAFIACGNPNDPNAGASVTYNPSALANGTYQTAYSANAGGATSDEDDVITYALKSGSTLPAGLSLNPSTGRISGTITANAGVYTFTLVASATQSKQTAEHTFTLTVNKAVVSVAQPVYYGPQLTFGDPLPEITTSSAGGTVALDANQTLQAGTRNYAWTFTPQDTDNYTWTHTTGIISLTVNKAVISVAQPSVSPETLTYGNPLPTITTTTTGGTIAFNVGQTLQAGTRNYNWTFTPHDAVNIIWSNLTGTVSLTVNKAVISVAQPSFSGGTLTYGDPLPAITTSTLGGTVALNSNQVLRAGSHSYAWTFTPADTNNFTTVTGTILLTVNQAVISVAQPVYAGAALTYGDPLPAITTSTTGGAVALDENQTLSAGTHPYTWTFTPADTDNFALVTGTVSLTVLKADQTIPDSVILTAVLQDNSLTQIALTNLGASYQYSRNNSTWQNSSIFTGLLANTSYTFYARLRETDNHFASEPISVSRATTPLGEEVFTYSGNSITGLTSLGATLTTLVFPAQISSTNITSIASYAFMSNQTVQEVIIPNSITSIGQGAFRSCTNLTSITIPFVGNTRNGTSNTHFGWIFGSTSHLDQNSLVPSSLKTVVITGGNSIRSSAFSGCTGLTSIEIPNSVTTIGWYAFEGCTGLTSITIPNSVTSIGSRAFYNCTSLQAITIPNSITTIESGAFFLCTSLTSIVIPNSVTVIGVQAFMNCTGLTSVTFESGSKLTTIEESAFEYCARLQAIEIPNSVTTIENHVFIHCISLTAITVDAANPNYASEDGVLFNKNKTTLVMYPTGKIGAYVVPNSVTTIRQYAFRRSVGLDTITISNSVTRIEQWAFSGSSLTEVIFQSGSQLTTIESGLFSFCTALTTITIPNSVTRIRDEAFWACTSLTSITIPNSVTTMGSYVFDECTSLTEVIFQSGSQLTAIQEGVFWGCASLISITIPASVTTISRRAFDYCTSLTAITVDAANPNYASEDGVLFNKNKTTLILCPMGKTGAYMIPDSVTRIGESAFGSCAGLTSITIPDSVTQIERHAFYDCTGLTSITIPNSVTTIGGWILYDCTSLTDVYIQGRTGRPSGWDSSWNEGVSATVHWGQ